MRKFVCMICGYVYEGDKAPSQCPQCKAPASKFKLMVEKEAWAAEHVVGIAKGVPEDIIADLRSNFQGECSEVGMYLAMARVAHREGYPEIGLYWEKAAWEEAVEAEMGATSGKTDLAKRAKALNLDAIHDTVHEMARDEARHGKALKGLLERYFK